MAQKREFESGGTVGMITPIKGTSMELNGQKQIGAEKPNFKASASPGGTKPERCSEPMVPMPR